MRKEIQENLLLFSSEFLKQKEYWKNKLSGDDLATTLITDTKPFAPKKTVERHDLVIPEELSRSIIQLSKGSDLSVYILLLAGLKTLIYRYTSNQYITILSPVYELNISKDTINKYVLIRDRVTGDMTFKELILAIKKSVVEAYQNQDYPLKKLLEFLFPASPLQSTAFITNIQCGLAGIHSETGEDAPGIDFKGKLSFSFEKSSADPRLKVGIRYDSFTYQAYFIGQIALHFVRIMEQGTGNVNLTLDGISMLSGEEKQRLLVDFNKNREDIDQDKTVDRWFADHARKTPEHIALLGPLPDAGVETRGIEECCALTYRELNKRANRLAQVLKDNGIGTDDPVGILLERSPTMVESILAVWKAGGAYIPLNAQYPWQRLVGILEDSRAKVLLTRSKHWQSQPGGPENKYHSVIIQLDKEVPGTPGGILSSACSPGNLAYIIYTSGSTGTPKGAMVEHIGMMNHIRAKINDLCLTYQSTVSQNSPHTFDISVWQFFTALTLGGKTVIYPDELTLDPQLFISRLIKNRVNILEVVPSYLAVMLELINVHTLPLEYLLVTGEQVKPGLLDNWFERYPGIPVVNAYGPTEASDDITHHMMDRTPGMDRVPIGKPLRNLDIYIIDNQMQLCPIGVKGEILVAGIGVGRGYLNNPEMTFEKFKTAHELHELHEKTDKNVPGNCVYMSHKSSRSYIYQTGDLGAWLPDGTIDFFGRKDYQVKIRGFRIELGEIEKKLTGHSAVKEAVVIDREDETGNKYLCAYFVPGTVEAPDQVFPDSLVEGLKTHLSTVLPDYMVPPYLVQLEHIPLTPNGKINRKALPEPVVSGARYTPPRDEMEEQLVEIWLEVLGKRPDALKIGIDTSFFELGGNSIKTIILISRIHKHFNVKIPLAELFALETIRGISRYLKNAAQDRFVSIEPTEKKDYYAVSSEQKRLFIIQQMEPESTNYNVSDMVVIYGELDKEQLEETAGKMIRRHEILRTSFELKDGEPVQRVYENPGFKVMGEEAREEQAKALVRNFIKPFDLGRAPLLRIGLIKTGAAKQILTVDAHHIVADGISVGIFVREFMSLFRGRQLPPPVIQYKDYAAWQNSRQRQKVLKEQEAYWLKCFEGELPVLDLPTDFPRPELQSFAGDILFFDLGKKETEALRALALQEGATLQIVMLAVFYILLAAASRQEDIIVGIPSTGRRHVDLTDIIGVFVNALALRNFPAKEKTFLKFLQEVKKNSLDAYDNQDYQFERLVKKLGASKDTGRNPLFDVIFEIQEMQVAPVTKKTAAVPEAREVPGKEKSSPDAEPYEYEQKTTKFDLDWTGAETPRGIHFWVIYCSKLFEKESIRLLTDRYLALIEAVIENPHARIKELDHRTDLEKELGRVQEVKFNF